MYGEQVVEVHSPEPISINSENENLKIKSFYYDDSKSVTYITIEGRDIQGERGKVLLSY